MFTGIVEEKGKILAKTSGSVTVGAHKVLEGTRVGDSISVNGICLTVTSLGRDRFCADVMPETLRRSSLGQCGVSEAVNLERAMPADGRFGGHIVSGHIDGTGIVKSINTEGNAKWICISCAPEMLKTVVEKGSVTLDGISLTVAEVGSESFCVSIIPHTLSQTALADRKAGDIVNIETDIIGKYVEKLLGRSEEKGLTLDYLKEMGF